MEELGQFIECDTCRSHPGTPPLCGGCISNRYVIAQLRDRAAPPPPFSDEEWSKIYVGLESLKIFTHCTLCSYPADVRRNAEITALQDKVYAMKENKK